MNRLRLLIISLIFFLSISVTSVFAEQINSFNSSITINPDGTIDVFENIEYDFESLDRHGIFRTIDRVKENQDGKKFVLDVDVISVTDEKDNPIQFDESIEGEYMNLKIGDPNGTISGVHSYRIKYIVGGALTYFSNHDELYWNTTGNEWEVPIAKASAAVTLPGNIAKDQIKTHCYTGYYGSTEGECLQSIWESQVSLDATRLLGPGEGMTIVIEFPKDIVAVLEPAPYQTFFETLWGKIVLVGIIVLGILWYFLYPLWIIVKWYTRGRDPVVGGPVAAWYDPPKTKSGRKLLPAEAGTIIDEAVNIKDVSATLVDLARRGYLKIEERKKNDFYLVEKKEVDDTLADYEKRLLEGIFSLSNEVRLKDKKLAGTVQEINTLVYNRVVTDKFFDSNPNTTRTFYSVIGALAFFTLNIPLALIAFLIGHHMPKKTYLGAEQAMMARSLKNFLKGQERQLTFQAKNQLWFEKLLPYAVAFGVEKYWAEQFKDIAMQEPDWYTGYGSTRGFNSVYFANSLSSSFSSFTRAATPTSSSSGFSSGGGGFSGGGGGGGGGGSW